LTDASLFIFYFAVDDQGKNVVTDGTQQVSELTDSHLANQNLETLANLFHL
jgi:hypothetical protein